MNDTLFNIPPTHRPRLEVWKEKYGVITEHYRGMDFPWCAIQPKAMETFFGGYGVKADMSIAEMGALVGRLIDEGGHEGRGSTEKEACEMLAERYEWEMPDSITEAECRIKK